MLNREEHGLNLMGGDYSPSIRREPADRSPAIPLKQGPVTLLLTANPILPGLCFVKDQSETFFVIHRGDEVRMNDEGRGSWN